MHYSEQNVSKTLISLAGLRVVKYGRFWLLSGRREVGAEIRKLPENTGDLATLPLPTFTSASALADSLASFLSDKIYKLRLSLTSIVLHHHLRIHLLLRKHPPDFSTFKPASESEISKILFNCPNKQCDSDPIPTWLLKECSALLVPTITNIFHSALVTSTTLSKNLSYHLSSRNLPWTKMNSLTTAQFPTSLLYQK